MLRRRDPSAARPTHEVLVSAHRDEEVDAYESDRVLRLEGGRVVAAS